MSSLSRLSRALAEGRRLQWRPGSREEVLERLLVKRAEARQAGLDSLERSLRQQIAWSLPVRRGEIRTEAEAGQCNEGSDARQKDKSDQS